MTETTNYKLKKSAENEYYTVDVPNENMDLIDAALTAQAGQIAPTAAKTTPVDADSLVLTDSEDGFKGKKLLWSALREALSANHATLFVPLTRKINGKALHTDIALAAADVGAVSARSVTTIAGVQIGAVTSVNSKTGAVTLGAAEVGARPDTRMPRLPEVGGSNRNLLHNWYFKKPVNQRGQTIYRGAGYCFDRWFFYCSAAGGTAEIMQGGIKITVPAGAEASFTQRVEKGCFPPEETYTRTALTDRGIQTITGRLVITAYGDFDFFDGMNFIDNKSGSTPYVITVFAVKLEKGSVQTLAHLENGVWQLTDPPPDFGEELRKCQRYQVTLGGIFRYRPCQITSSLIDFAIPTPVTLRGNPSFHTGAVKLLSFPTGVEQTGFAFQAAEGTANSGFVMRCIKSGHGLTDAMLSFDPGTLFDANL